MQTAPKSQKSVQQRRRTVVITVWKGKFSRRPSNRLLSRKSSLVHSADLCMGMVRVRVRAV